MDERLRFWSLREGAAAGFLAAATVVLIAPFLDKAYHIDDPLFLWTARQIREHPLDPFGFTVNWRSTATPMAELTKNPPLASYFIAAASSALGWSEPALHLAFLLPALGVTLGTFLLARRLCREPLLASLITLASPVFLVSATGVMCDTLMLAFWVWAVFLWVEGLERDRAAWLAGSATLVAAASLTKYFGLSLIPLLLAYTLFRKRRLDARLAYLSVPAVALIAYLAWTLALYGRALPADAASYAVFRGAREDGSGPVRVLVGLAFTGGCLAPVLLLAPLLWRGRGLLFLSMTGVAAGLFAVWTTASSGPFRLETAQAGAVSTHFGLFVAGGAAVVGLAVRELRRPVEPEGLLLGLWVLGTFVFAGVVNWTVNGRSVLPMAPAAAILLGRRFQSLRTARPAAAEWAARTAVALAGGLALLVAWSDLRLANSARTAAAIVRERTRGEAGSLWFQGHWGFQYYMEAIGARPLDVRATRMRSGDLMVIPENNTTTVGAPAPIVASRESFEVESWPWATTMHHRVGAGFHSHVWGPLPFRIGSVPPERYDIVRVKRPPPEMH